MRRPTDPSGDRPLPCAPTRQPPGALLTAFANEQNMSEAADFDRISSCTRVTLELELAWMRKRDLI